MPAPRRILPVMIGTAGHVHHGKSALVKLLTGCDTMRLPEERKRQLTIDLGFAPCHLGSDRLAGIIDVPGHEDFIRTMVAGASAIDVLLLVVAADDGVMPQTREHLTIVATLRAPQAMAVVTKCDLVEPARATAVAGEVAALLATAGFPDAPVVPASCRTGEGLEQVWTALERLVDAAAARPADTRAFRLDVERSFTVAGHGSVATGVARSGAAAVGDELEVLPAGAAARLLGVQAFRRDATRVGTGTCTALNLKDVPLAALGRGAVVAAPGILRAEHGAVVWLRNVSADAVLKRRSELRLHAGTADVVAQVRLLGAETLAPGDKAAALVQLREPLVLAAGDRVLLRALTPQATVAGGTVLAAGLPAGRPPADLAARAATARTCAAAGDVLGAALLAGPAALLADAEVRRLTQLPGESAAAALERRDDLLALGRRGGGRPSHWAVRARLDEPLAALERACAAHHRAHPREWGPAPAQAAADAGLTGIDDPLPLVQADPHRRLALRHGRLGLAAHQPAVEERLARLRDELLARIRAAGLRAPARGDLLTALAAPERDLDAAAKLLVDAGLVQPFPPNWMDAEALAGFKARLPALAAPDGALDLGALRQATGMGRNLLVAVLESCDKEGLTRRQGAGRVLARR